MSRLNRYVFALVLGPFLYFALALSVIVWLAQSLRFLDLIINRGQSALVFLEFSVLLLPTIFAIAGPVAFGCAALFALNRLATDSELVVLWASGLSRIGIATPLLAASLLVTAALYVVTLYLIPTSAQATRLRLVEVRADIAAALLKDGAFTTPVDGLTVFVGETSREGRMRAVLAHDDRDPDRPLTYIAEEGQVVRTDNGARLIMLKGVIQETRRGTGRVSYLAFDRYVFDLSEYVSDAAPGWVKPKERFLPELLFPGPEESDPQHRRRLIAEGHEQLTAPLYAPAFAAVAAAAMLSGAFDRRRRAWRIAAAALAMGVLKINGLALQNLASASGAVIPLLYVVPLGTLAAMLALLAAPRIRLLRRVAARAAPTTA